MKIHNNPFIRSLFPVIIGVIGFLVVAGPDFLNPKNVAWLVGGDPLMHYLGWAFYKASPWSNPVGLSPWYGMEFSNSIVYTDSIPLFAIPFKLIATSLPDTFQYFGLWTLLCFVLQSYFAFRIIGLFTKNVMIQSLACALIMFSPPFLFRLSLHASLMAHFLILAALYLNLKDQWLTQAKYNDNNCYQSKLLGWLVLLLVAVMIHFYIFIMVLILWLADLHSRLLTQKVISIKLYFFETIFIFLSIVIIAWQCGYFSVRGESVTAVGYGDFRTNLLALFNSEGWSYWIPPIEINDQVQQATGEGFQFLGAGNLLLGLIAILIYLFSKSRPAITSIVRQYPILILSVALMAIISFSNHISVGSWNYRIPLPDYLLIPLSTVRSSARFFWPMYYLIVLAILYFLIRKINPKILIVLLGASVVLQATDSSAGWLAIRQKISVPPSEVFKTPLKNKFWDSAGNHYKNVVSNITEGGWEDFGIYASSHQMATNITRFTRVNFSKQMSQIHNIEDQIYKGPLNPQSLYIIREWKYAENKEKYRTIKFDPANDLLARIDNFNVLAPGWKSCITCPPIGADLEIETLVPVIKIGEEIEFSKNGNGKQKYMLEGWGYAENWGTWGTDSTARLVIPLPDGGPSKIAFRFNAFLTPANPELKIDILINDVVVASKLGISSQENLIEISLPAGLNKKGETVDIKFKAINAVSPKSVGIGDDHRKLGIGLKSVKLIK